MITREQAFARMKEYVDAQSRETGLELAILDDYTLEYDFGWVFFYNTRAFLLSNDDTDSLVGNAPVIIDKGDGSLYETGTAHPIEYYVASYEKHRMPYPPNE